MSSDFREIFLESECGQHQLSFTEGLTLRDVLSADGVAINSDCGGNGSCGLCVVQLEESGVFPFTSAERARLSAKQLSEGCRLACQIRTEQSDSRSPIHVSLVKDKLQAHWRALREDEYCSFEIANDLRIPSNRYGVAIDLGTTQIRLTLWDLVAGKRLAGRSGFNPQGSYGTDVLNRLMVASDSIAVASEMRHLVVEAIAEALTEMQLEAGIDSDDIGKLLVVGNTAMLTLLAGKNFKMLMYPENWASPIDCQPDDIEYYKLAWRLANNAEIEFIQAVGGFIGSDLLAGLLATQLTEHDTSALLVDFGTNSEIALWDGQRLLVTSAAGGPAFEGNGISCGMSGETGAIYRVQAADSGRFDMQVLGNETARGVCGSGLVDLVALLRQTEKLDRVGRFQKDIGNAYIVSESPHIELQKGDIDLLQRAKAAIGAGIAWLCNEAGLTSSSLQRVYACGAFGRLLDISHAQSIGMLPMVESEKIKLEGNSSLAGCEMLLLSADREQLLSSLLSVVEVHNLAEDEAFESLFVKYLYLQPIEE